MDERAERTGEWRAGVARALAAPAPPQAFAPYRRALERRQPSAAGPLRFYPGSPALILDALRESDRLVAVERHPEEAADLARALGRDPRLRIAEEDGWAAAKALTPPTPRRGLMLIDPPFERPGEFDRMLGALGESLKRWATGVHLLWRPVKDLRAGAGYERGLRRTAGQAPTLTLELRVRPESAGGLLGSALDVVNPPFGLDVAMSELGPWLATTLADPAGAWRAEWLTPPR